MTIEQQGIAAVFVFKILTLLIGALLVILGYRLFVKGYFYHGGEMYGKIGSNRLQLKNAAPGTSFAIFGAVIIGFAVYKGFTVSNNASPTHIVFTRPIRGIKVKPSIVSGDSIAGKRDSVKYSIILPGTSSRALTVEISDTLAFWTVDTLPLRLPNRVDFEKHPL